MVNRNINEFTNELGEMKEALLAELIRLDPKMAEWLLYKWNIQGYPPQEISERLRHAAELFDKAYLAE